MDRVNGPPCRLAFSWIWLRQSPDKKSEESRSGLGIYFSSCDFCAQSPWIDGSFDWVAGLCRVSLSM